MAVRNYKQLSSFLQEISSRLIADNDLCKLLYFNDTAPLSHTNLTTDEKKDLIFGKLIRFIPKVGPQETTRSKIAMALPGGDKSTENKEIIQLPIQLFVYVPFSDWVIEGDDLRVFLIMSKIEEVLDGKDIKGVGRMQSLDFEMVLTTDELCCYRMGFMTDVFA